MPRTIYSTAGAFPVALEGTKRVKTFPSGLVLVTQDYAVPRGQEADYAATFAVGQPLEVDSPAIDGLYIFPEPEWVDSGDGFTRLTVTAYGRSNTAPKYEYSAVRYIMDVSTNTVNPDTGESNVQNQPVVVVAQAAASRFVVPKNTTPAVSYGGNPLKIFSQQGQEMSNYSINGEPFEIIKSTYLQNINSTNFGNFEEIVCSYQVSASVYATFVVS
jgi:hypothetical protein